MTSLWRHLRLTQNGLRADFFVNMWWIVAERGAANFQAKFPVLQELVAKNHRGTLCLPPPQRARVKRLGLITSEREARSEFLLIYTKNLSMSGRPWWRFWEAYISGTVSLIDKRSSLVGNSIPSAVYGTTVESCQCLLWHVARATWGDVTNVPPVVSR